MFTRGGKFYLHVPVRGGSAVQKSTGTADKRLAKRMHAMVLDLRDRREWAALELVSTSRATLGQLWDAYAHHAVEAFVGREASPKWETLVEGWLRTLRVGAGTITAYRRQVAAVLPSGERVFGLTPGVIRDGFAQLSVSSGTALTYYAAVSSFLHYCVAHDLLAVHPMSEKARVPRPKKQRPRTMWMTAAEDLRLCLAAPSPYREYFALVHSTGAERNAALAMTRDDVDLTRWDVHIPGTKNARRDRRGVPVDAWARPLLGAYVRAVLRGPLFPTLTKCAVNAAHIAARTAAGLPGYQLRDARHSVAIRWHVLDRVPMYDVAERLGHADQTMAITVYTKTVLRDAAARLGVESHVFKQEA